MDEQDGATPPPVVPGDLGRSTAPGARTELPDGGAPAAASDEDLLYQQRLGERLREIRRARGLRLQDVETGSDGRFKAVVVGSYERGDRAVSAHKLASLAAFYEVPLSELLPGDQWPGSSARDEGIRLAVDRLREASSQPELAPLHRLVQHVQRLRGDYNGRVLSLRGDDLRTVAVALGIEPSELGAWLAERGLLSPL